MGRHAGKLLLNTAHDHYQKEWFRHMQKNTYILLIPLFLLLVSPHITAGPTWTRSAVAFNGMELISVAVSPSGKYVAAVLGDKTYYTRILRVYDTSLQLVYTMPLSSFSSSEVSFLNETVLIIVEYIWNAQVPFSYVHMVNLATGNVLTSPKIQGTYLQGIKKTVVLGKTLYVLTQRYLLGFNLDNLSRTYLKAFLNSGLQMIPINQNLLVLSIETSCHICLSLNEKTITLLTPNGEKSTTEDHILQLVRLPGEKIGIVYDNGTVTIYMPVNDSLKYFGKLQLSQVFTRVSEPSYDLLYSLNIDGLDVNLLIYNFSENKVRRYHLPLPYTKGDTLGIRVYDDGRFLAWDNDTVVFGGPQGFEGEIDCGEKALNAFYVGGYIYVISTDKILIYQRKILEDRYLLTVDVLSEEGSPLSNFSISLNGEKILANNSSISLLLPSGVYNITIWAPGYDKSIFNVNLTSDLRRVITLKRTRYPLVVHASTTLGEPPEIVVYRGDSALAKGMGILEVNLLPGNYTVIVKYGNTSTSRIVNLVNRTELSLRLNITSSTTTSSNATVPSHPQTNLTEYIVIYGEQTCPDCRQTKDTLQRLSTHVYFKDISNQSFLNEYDLLYQICGAGNSRIVPLTLVFRGSNLQAVVAGPLPIERWIEILNMNNTNSTLVVTDDGRWISRSLNSTLIYGIAVTGISEKNYASKTWGNVLPLILALAAADSINPCTFMIFAALVMAVMGLSGRKMAIQTSIAFISAVFLSYTLLGIGLIRFVSFFSWLKYVVGGITVAIGLYSLMNASVKYSEGCREEKNTILPAIIRVRGILSSLNEVKNRIENLSHSFMVKARSGSFAAAFLAGVLVSFTLLPCSSGPYLIASYILSRESLFTMVSLLLLYNIVFVMPLILIAIGAIIGGRLLLMVDVVTVRLNALRRWTEIFLGILLVILGIYVMFYH